MQINQLKVNTVTESQTQTRTWKERNGWLIGVDYLCHMDIQRDIYIYIYCITGFEEEFSFVKLIYELHRRVRHSRHSGVLQPPLSRTGNSTVTSAYIRTFSGKFHGISTMDWQGINWSTCTSQNPVTLVISWISMRERYSLMYRWIELPWQSISPDIR